MNRSMSQRMTRLEKYLIAHQIRKWGYSEKFSWISPNSGIMSLLINFLISRSRMLLRHTTIHGVYWRNYIIFPINTMNHSMS